MDCLQPINIQNWQTSSSSSYRVHRIILSTAFDNSFAETTLLGLTKYIYIHCCQSSLATVLSLVSSLRLPLAFSLSILRGSTLRRPSSLPTSGFTSLEKGGKSLQRSDQTASFHSFSVTNPVAFMRNFDERAPIERQQDAQVVALIIDSDILLHSLLELVLDPVGD